MRNILKFIITFLIILSLYIIPAQFAPFDKVWYNTLNKPALTPPNIVFPIVWTILFILISISITIIIQTPNDSKRRYFIILFLNYIFIQLYSYFQFGLQNLTIAFIDVILVLITTFLLIIETNKINKKAAYLLIPLLIWVIFASFLQLGIIKLNN